MIAYVFWINSMVKATVSTNLYGIILWQMYTYLVNKKQEIHMIHKPWLSRRWSMVLQLQVVEHVPRKYFPINLFDIHERLYYRCAKIWMVKIWQIFGQSSILPNFTGTKVSLHTVVRDLLWNIVNCKALPLMYCHAATYWNCLWD